MDTRSITETLHTFLFADLAGYTALTEAHGDQDAADLAEEFCSAVREVLPEYGAEVVKTLGDALMIRVDDAGAAVSLGIRIANEIGQRHNFPGVRVGMDTGCAVGRDGDWFGATVNVAARISGAARAGEVLLSGATREAAGDRTDIQFHERGRQTFKNVAAPLSIYAATEHGEQTDEGFPIDPVCRMAVDPDRSAGNLRHEGVEYTFCSLACVKAFSQTPEAYVKSGPDQNESEARGGSDLVALVQGASYVGFGLWSTLARRHYRRIHDLPADGWILNAHGGWLLVVGSTLVLAGARRRSEQSDVQLLGAGAALGLAVNDAVSAARNGVARIYISDLAYEAALVLGWSAAALKRRTT
ncbi:MAG: YHS domain-containing protein [Thermoleophilaceae bacterium]|nr:YHS domain-containing protein [Thermoleophilaceae bacterium]